MATDSAARAESDLLQAITHTEDPDRPYEWASRGFDAWTFVAALWLHAHRTGTPDPALITAAAKKAVAQRVCQVRDVTKLPSEPAVGVHPCDTPASWADRVLATVRDRMVGEWVDRAEMTLHALRGAQRRGDGTEPERALLVTGWPLTDNASARLSYLTRYPPLVSPVVVDVLDRRYEEAVGYGGRTALAVLRVPHTAAEQAHAISPAVQSVPITTGTDAVQAACGLMRDYGVLAHPDNLPATSPSALVRAERDRLATALTDGPYQPHPRPFAHSNPDLPPHVPLVLRDQDRGWTPWSARAAFDRRGSIYIPGADDPHRFALAFADLPAYSATDVQVRIEVPAGTVPFLPRHGSQVPAIEHPPTDNDAGLIDVRASLHGLTADQTGVLLRLEPCRDPIAVPMAYIVAIHAL